MANKLNKILKWKSPDKDNNYHDFEISVVDDGTFDKKGIFLGARKKLTCGFDEDVMWLTKKEAEVLLIKLKEIMKSIKK